MHKSFQRGFKQTTDVNANSCTHRLQWQNCCRTLQKNVITMCRNLIQLTPLCLRQNAAKESSWHSLKFYLASLVAPMLGLGTQYNPSIAKCPTMLEVWHATNKHARLSLTHNSIEYSSINWCGVLWTFYLENLCSFTSRLPSFRPLLKFVINGCF